MTTGSGAPVVETRYDTYDADPGARIRMEPITGLVGMVYNNTGFTGVPSDRSIGPRVNGRPTQTMAFGYNANPSGAGGVWSMRLAGKFIAPTEGTYQFRSTTNARLTINAMTCTVQAPCRQQLRRNAAADIQAEIVSGTNGVANVSLEVAGADNRWQPINAAQTAPGLNEVTEQETTDQLATGRGAVSLKQTSEYDLETGSANLLKQTSSSGATVSHTWAENTGVDGQYGQHLTWTAPDGHTTYYGYHGATAQASGCDGPPANQGGQLAITTRPGAITTEQTYDAAGSTNKATGQGTETCVNYRPDGSAESGAVTGDGPSYAVSSTPMLFNNPLVSSGTTTTQGVTNTATQSVSITGQLFQSTDSHGTVTTHAYDPNTGHPTVTRTVTANGETRVYTYNYDRFGQPTSQAVNGKTLSTTTYRNDGTIANVRYKNGTTSAITLDANNNADAITYAGFAGGATIGETNTFSRDNAILSRTLRGTDGTATTQATYNQDHRIISAVNTGTIDLTTRSKTVAFEGQAGSNGNRTSQTTTTTNNKQQTATFSYNEANQLTSTTQENIGTPTYDSHGRATSIGNPTTGDSTLNYDAGGHLIEATGPNGTIAFTGTGDTIYTPTPTEPPTEEPAPETPAAEEPEPDTTEPAPDTTEQAPEPAPTTDPKAGTETTAAKAESEAPAARQRAAKAAPTGPITLRTSGNLLLDETGNIAGQIISLPQGVTVALDANSNPVEWLYNDLQGSTAWKTTGNTAPAHTTVYDPWGTQISTHTQPLPTTALELALYSNGWKGTGRLPIGNDFYTMGNREYSPQAGRFLQRDPLIGGSTNAYEYALGDPWNNTDPSGNMSIGKWVGLAVSVLASAILSIATAGAYAAIAAATIGAAVKGYAASFAVGAVAGAVSGFASSTVEQAIDTGDIDWQRVGASVLIGGAIGGVAGAAQYGAIYSKQALAAAQADAVNLKNGMVADAQETLKTHKVMLHRMIHDPTIEDMTGFSAQWAKHDEAKAIIGLFNTGYMPEGAAYGSQLFTVKNVLINAGVSSLGGAAAWGTGFLVPTPTAGGVPTPVSPALDPSDGTVDVGSEGAVLLDGAFG
ncbi:RHS repeat-associated core domain [Actinobacteria bacterium IMCC26207]|nr:RHS repeat-associated core domain [Actinobacteria bacterium IMCC26207]